VVDSLLLNKIFKYRMLDLMNFTVYSREGCPYCTKIQQVLQLAELKHVIYKLNRDFDRESFYEQFGQGSTFPQVVLNGDNLGGCTETVKYLQEKNLV
jgi:glutaredoxin